MTESNAIIVADQYLDPTRWEQMKALAESLVQSKAFPKAIQIISSKKTTVYTSQNIRGRKSVHFYYSTITKQLNILHLPLLKAFAIFNPQLY